MGQKHSTESLLQSIEEDIGLPQGCCIQCNGSSSGSTLCCMVPQGWYNQILHLQKARRIGKGTWPDAENATELRLQLASSSVEPDVEQWAVSDGIKVCMKVIRKRFEPEEGEGLPSIHRVERDAVNAAQVSSSFSAYLCHMAVKSESQQWDALRRRLAQHPSHGESKTSQGPVHMTAEYLQLLLSAMGLGDVPIYHMERDDWSPGDGTEVFHKSVGNATSRPSLRSPGGAASVDFVIESDNAFYLFSPYIQHSIQSLIMYSSKMQTSSNAKPLFIVFQLLQYLRTLHLNGLTHGNLKPANILLDQALWVTVTGVRSSIKMRSKRNAIKKNVFDVPRPLSVANPTITAGIDHASYGKLLKDWTDGWIGNFEYLMGINRLAGRSTEDPAHHPILPWVVDFTSPTAGWRDFTRSKYRLNKGDQQLDFTYNNGGTEGLVKYHVSDILSEITYFVYFARRTPKTLLCKHVRSNWVPEEYPSSMERLYTWTPDECVPAFYTDPTIFNSIHDDLPPLGLPRWVTTPEQFIDWHMTMLESDFVSSQLHHWIDLNFGHKLSGRAAVEAKNVVLSIVQPSPTLANHGVLQLFKTPHPRRACVPVSNLSEVPLSSASLPTDSVTSESTSRRISSATSPMGNVARTTSKGWLSSDSEVASLFGPDSTIENLLKKGPGTESPETVRASQSTSGGKLSRSIDSTPGHIDGSMYSELNEMLEARTRTTGGATHVPATGTLLGDEDQFAAPSAGSSPSAISWGSFSKHRTSRIPLPKNYTPVRSLQQVESISSFLQVVEGSRSANGRGSSQDSAFNEDLGTCASVDDTGNEFQNAVAFDMRSVGCIIAELFVSDVSNTWLARAAISSELDVQLNHLSRVIRTLASSLPLCVREGVIELVTSNPNDQLTVNDLLYTRAPQPMISFPVYFEQLYEVIATYKREVNLERRADVIRKCLKFMISLPDEGLSIALPLILELFTRPESQRQALDIFDAVGRRLGQAQCTKLFRLPIFELHESCVDAAVHSKLFSKRILLSMVSHFGLDIYVENFLQFLIDGLSHKNNTIARAAARGISAVGKVLGPVLSARLIVRPLLRILVKPNSIFAVSALAMLADEFGVSLLTKMYLPFLQDNVETYLSKMGPKSEYFLRSAALLLRRTLGLLTESELRELAEDIVQSLFQPILQCLVSVHVSFPNSMRPQLSRLFVELIMCISRAIDRDTSHECLISILQLFFSAFDWIHATPLANPTVTESTRRSKSGKPVIEASTIAISPTLSSGAEGLVEDLSVLSDAFSAKLAAYAYSNFCQLIGQETMRRSLYNSSLVEQLMYDTEPDARASAGLPNFIPPQLSMYAENDLVFDSEKGTFDGVYEDSIGSAPDVRRPILKQNLLAQQAVDDKNGWIAHLQDQIAAKSRFPQINFKFSHVETFHGHSSAIRASTIFNNEQCVVSASRDKTVRIWSIKHTRTSNEDACRRTYLGHRKGVFEVMYIARSGHITSCDGSIHVWDPENGYCLRQYEFRRNPAVSLTYVLERNALLAGTHESTLKLLDIRASKSVSEWRPSSTSHGSIKCVAVDETSSWIVVGFSSGLVSLMDVRTGLLLYCWRAHEHEVTSVRTLPGQRFITCSTDHSAVLWSWGGHENIVNATCRFKGGTDAILASDTVKNKLYLVSSSSRVTSYSDYDDPQNFKLDDRPKKVKGIKGNISTFNLLPMNQLVLFGSESGTISLFR